MALLGVGTGSGMEAYFSTLFRKELNPFGTFSNVKGRFSGSISVPVQNPSH